jgi:hypothetical protein
MTSGVGWHSCSNDLLVCPQVLHVSAHPHPLSLSRLIGEKEDHPLFFCDACGATIDHGHDAYFCTEKPECDFVFCKACGLKAEKCAPRPNPETYNLLFTDSDGKKYEFIAKIVRDVPQEDYFLLASAGVLNTTSNKLCIVYKQQRGGALMTCCFTSLDEKEIHITTPTQEKIRQWFAQFRRNDEGSRMCRGLDTKFYCGFFHTHLGIRPAETCSLSAGQCTACEFFEKGDSA